MVVTAHAAVAYALADHICSFGECLRTVRQWYAIPAVFPDAAQAWEHVANPHPGDRNPPRGAPVYWIGGSHGHGHIALSLGDGMIRSPDSGGWGVIATVPLRWPETHWGLHYGGWAWSINGVSIPHGLPKQRTGR